MDDRQEAGAAAPEVTATQGAFVTPVRFLGALAVACVLLFLLLVVFAFTGLGPLGLAPAVVVAMALTSRVTGIRRMPVLVALGMLSFVIVVVVTYVVAIAVLLNAEPPIAH